VFYGHHEETQWSNLGLEDEKYTADFSFGDEKYDYTGGHLDEMLDIIIDSGATLFVSAVGVAPQWAIDKLHKAGVL
tara:strand:- start:4672 stop:4899 length:228 start_codon:yes stop_codon:yes gene_type:complete